MGKTGTYKYNPETGNVEKISDNASVPSRVYFPRDSIHSGAHFENLHDRTFSSAKKKREYMKRHGIAEVG